jgi:hypothetical protein
VKGATELDIDRKMKKNHDKWEYSHFLPKDYFCGI